MDQSLQFLIKEEQKKGASKEATYQKLLSQGKTLEEIEKAYEELTAPEKHEDLQKKVVKVFVTFGALLIGAGIFSFVAANWQEMPKNFKVSLLIGAQLAFYILGYFLKEEKKLEKTGEAIIFLGSITFGASIFLIAQIFNVRADWPEGFVIWFLGSIGLAYTFNSKLLFLAYSVLAAIAVFSQPTLLYKPTLLPYLSLFLLTALLTTTFITGFYTYKKHIEEDKI